MSDIELPPGLSPGEVSAIYFVVLEFITLAVVDVILIHVISSLWYKQIVNGVALEVKTAEIPGVANSLVGQYRAPPNLFGYFVKLVVLGLILLADVNINSKVKDIVDNPERQLLTGTFDFDTSVWGNGEERAVTRPNPDIRGCRVLKPSAETITFHRIRFNFTNNVVVENENSDFVFPINDSSIVCMKRGSAKDYKDNVLVTVNGCSRYQTTKCTNESIVKTGTYPLPPPSDTFPTTSLSVYLFSARKFVLYTITDYSSIAANIFDVYAEDYSELRLSCMPSMFSIMVDGTKRKTNINDCFLTARVKSGGQMDGTLIEHWEYEEDNTVFKRRFPGPVFDRVLDVSEAFKVIILREISQINSWEDFSSFLIAKGVVYDKDFNPNVIRVRGTKPVTVLPLYTVIPVVLLVVVTAIVGIVVIRTVGKDTKPKINTINGLSSIAREETEPTGRSLIEGHYMTVGLSKRNTDEAHFGPLRSNDVRVTLREARNIV